MRRVTSDLSRYKKLEKIGEGTYGLVYKAKDKETDVLVALKKIRLESAEQGTPSTAVREISILRQLHHSNIVSLYEVIHTQKSLTLVFEYLEQDLKNYLDALGDKGIEISILKSFLHQLIQGIAHCHRNHVLHRDLKPQNLLISAEGELKVADFGLARAWSIPVKQYTHEVVTLWYRPPDVLMGNMHYDTSVDIWGIGCIFAEMASGRPLFCGASDPDQLIKIFKVLGTPTIRDWAEMQRLPGFRHDLPKYKHKPLQKLLPRLDKDGLSLLEAMLQYDPKKRISADQALHHSYFNDLPKKK